MLVFDENLLVIFRWLEKGTGEGVSDIAKNGVVGGAPCARNFSLGKTARFSLVISSS
jgi:hypothetical protein